MRKLLRLWQRAVQRLRVEGERHYQQFLRTWQPQREPRGPKVYRVKMTNKEKQVLRVLSNADALFVEPGFLVEQRTIFGVHGDEADPAISLQWRDSAGCIWESDFTEKSLLDADVTGHRITLKDSGGASVCVQLHRLKPMKL
jgi:hypothetical protein